TVQGFAQQLNSPVSGLCSTNTGTHYQDFGLTCTNGILTVSSAATSTAATATASGTTATFSAGASWNAIYAVNTPIVVSGCSVAGYNGTWAVYTVGGTTLTTKVSSSGLGAATGCTVKSEVPALAMVKTFNSVPYLFAQSDRNGQAAVTFTLAGM